MSNQELNATKAAPRSAAQRMRDMRDCRKRAIEELIEKECTEQKRHYHLEPSKRTIRRDTFISKLVASILHEKNMKKQTPIFT